MRIATMAACAAYMSLAGGACAQNFPLKPIRFLVGAPPGCGADFVARTLRPGLAESLGQTVVVESRRTCWSRIHRFRRLTRNYCQAVIRPGTHAE
jgi:tripartite-type tricarboxylate transporter receptor subunit TctC